MSKGVVSISKLNAIADAVRGKTGSSETMTLDEIATTISTMSSAKHGVTIDNLLGDVNSSGVLQHPTGDNVNLVFNDIKNVVSYGLYYKFSRNPVISTVTFPDLKSLTNAYALQYTFNACTQLKSASFPVCETITATSAMANIFYGCTELVTVSFPMLETINISSVMQYAFYNCPKLESIDFSSLKTIGASTGSTTNNRQFYYAFNGCTKLTEITFPSLEAIYCNGTSNSYGTFGNNNKIQKLYFPKLTTISKTPAYSNTSGADYIFYNCTALTEIHFGVANQTAIEATTGYSTKWGASNATIYFDL